MPSSSTRTRLASMPRMTGRLAPAAKPEPVTPGTVASASARLPPSAFRMSSRLTLATMVAKRSGSPAMGDAVTTTVSMVACFCCADAGAMAAAKATVERMTLRYMSLAPRKDMQMCTRPQGHVHGFRVLESGLRRCSASPGVRSALYGDGDAGDDLDDRHLRARQQQRSRGRGDEVPGL